MSYDIYLSFKPPILNLPLQPGLLFLSGFSSSGTLRGCRVGGPRPGHNPRILKVGICAPGNAHFGIWDLQ